MPGIQFSDDMKTFIVWRQTNGKLKIEPEVHSRRLSWVFSQNNNNDDTETVFIVKLKMAKREEKKRCNDGESAFEINIKNSFNRLRKMWNETKCRQTEREERAQYGHRPLHLILIYTKTLRSTSSRFSSSTSSSLQDFQVRFCELFIAKVYSAFFNSFLSMTIFYCFRSLFISLIFNFANWKT